MNSISIFFSKIKELTFWQRLFSWKNIRSLSYDAYQEIKVLEERLSFQASSLESYKESCHSLEIGIQHANDKINQAREIAVKQESTIDRLQDKISDLDRIISELRNTVTSYEHAEERNKRDHEIALGKMLQAQFSFERDSKRLQDERLAEKDVHLANMKKQWANHETAVKQVIRGLCDKYTITYVEKVPFRGNPDNTIEICGEYIIFDAKCPANDNHDNFPTYIKSQVEAAKKYAREEKVKRDVFLVIPSTTVDKISQWSYNMGDYNVFIITKDALEPVILSLKKIEDYEFVDQMTPEERENISRVIAKFAHTTKRRIQIDQFFANQFLEILRKCEGELPEDFIRQVIEFEKAEKLNPPTEKRTKQILVKDLSDKHDKTNAEARLRDLEIPQKLEDIRNWA